MSEQINEINLEAVKITASSYFKKFKLSRKDTLYSIGLFLSAILVSAFGVFGGFRGGFTVSAIILTATLSAFLFTKGYKFKVFPVICLLLSIGVSLSFAITSNGAVRFWSFVCFYCLTLTWLTAITRNETNRGNIGFFCYILSPVIESLMNLPAAVVSIFHRDKKTNKTILKICIGVGLALPLLFVIVPLLMNSDQAFSGMVILIFSKTASIIGRSIFGIVMGFFIVSYALSLKKDVPLIKTGFSPAVVSPTIAISFLSVLSLCYLSYLFSQLSYFFNAFFGFLPEGYEFTVANYARRGFFEMTIIAAINFAVIFLCRLLTKMNNKKSAAAVNVLSTFISVFTLIIIFTALSKMFLYIKSFGMTKLRITTSVFMIFLAAVFISLILKLYLRGVNVLKTAFVAAALSLIILGTVNVNSIIAGYNYNAYKQDILEEIDIETIADLGDEGVPYLVLLTEADDFSVRNEAAYYLSLAYDDYYYFVYNENNEYNIEKRIYDELGNLSISRQKAYAELDAYYEKNPDILTYKNKYEAIPDDYEYGIW